MISQYEQFKFELSDILIDLEKFYMVTHFDQHGSITYTNKEFLQTSKWTPKRVLGKTLWQMFPDTQESQKQAHHIWYQLSQGNSWSGTVEKITRFGDSYFVKSIAIPVIRSNEGFISGMFVEIDMTEDVQLREQLKQIAFFDYETGLMSRHNLETTVNELIESKESFTFVYIAINQFYTLTDSSSNESRAEIIKSFTNRLKRFFKNNQIARIGANEFVVLTQFGSWFIEGFVDFLNQHPIYIDNTALPLSISGGIIQYPNDQKTYSHLMQAAHTATNEVNEQGGGKIVAPSTSFHKEFNRKSMIDQKLLVALNNNELQVVYQPQIDSLTGKILLYEALIRWNDDELGSISPDELIPIAEENGLIHKIGAFVLTEAAQLAVKLKAEGHAINIAVNSSVREFSNPNLKDELMGILQKASCPPSLIHLEITEKFAFKAEEEHSVSHQMHELQKEGIKFALDDFGTGYASFRYMQSLPISKVKIDKFFIKSLMTHKQTKQLVEGMIKFAKSMGLFVIAEGVETEEQLNLLKKLGIDAAQGYYLGIPVTADKIISS